MKLKYAMPTRILMDKDCVQVNRSELLPFGKKALIVTGAHSAKISGALTDVISSLVLNEQTYVVFDRVTSNPGLACVYEGASVAKSEKVDFVIAIGGGSPMDAAKIIALLSCQPMPESAIFTYQFGPEALPLVLIPTTAGTGSEVTPYAILTNEESQTKTSIANTSLFPRLALLDAKYIRNVSQTITINTAIDALTHSIEGLFSVRANDITDLLAYESIRLVSSCFENMASNALTEEQREHLLYGSTLGGMVIANTGTTALHAMGYPLTFFRGIDHGRANGLLLAWYLEYLSKTRNDLVAKILSAMKINSISDLTLLMDRLLGEYEKVSLDEMKKFAAKAIISKSISNCVVVAQERDLLNIFMNSFAREQPIIL